MMQPSAPTIERKSFYCEICMYTTNSHSSFTKHLESQKHSKFLRNAKYLQFLVEMENVIKEENSRACQGLFNLKILINFFNNKNILIKISFVPVKKWYRIHSRRVSNKFLLEKIK